MGRGGTNHVAESTADVNDTYGRPARGLKASDPRGEKGGDAPVEL